MFESSAKHFFANGEFPWICPEIKDWIFQEDELSRHFDSIASHWNSVPRKQSDMKKLLNRYKEKLPRLEISCSLQELAEMRLFFTVLQDLRAHDLRISHYLRRISNQMEMIKSYRTDCEINRLAEALASIGAQLEDPIQAQNDARVGHTQLQLNEEKRTAPSEEPHLTEIAKALAKIRNKGQNSGSGNDDLFIPMPPGWSSKAQNDRQDEEIAQLYDLWNVPEIHHFNSAPAQTPVDPVDVSKAPGYRCPFTCPSPPADVNRINSLKRIKFLPRSLLDERPISKLYNKVEPKLRGPSEHVPSPSEIGGDEFWEEEKPVLRNSAWKVVGCKDHQAPATMAAVVKMSLSSESKYKPCMWGPSAHNVSKPKVDIVYHKPRSIDSTGSRSTDIWESSDEESEPHSDPLTDPSNPLQATSIWVGNLTPNIAKEMLYPHFMKIGNINNIVMTQENHCAFVNFENPRAAGRAMRNLQGLVVGGVKLLLRYPNRFLGGDHTNKLKDATAVYPGRPKRGGPSFQAMPRKPHKKWSK
ncbi:uncharacterized protein LOC135947238 isoform X2 [Cloeon dipterum]|uniref:uncharacterized protein LOC135947238 isoform X2 n=1 Tax=Cloeon dipterum TaxID=197152 RepID=UPI0032200B75